MSPVPARLAILAVAAGAKWLLSQRDGAVTSDSPQSEVVREARERAERSSTDSELSAHRSDLDDWHAAMTEEQGVTGAAPRPGQDLAEYLDGLNSFGMDHLVAMRMRDARRGQIVRDSAAGPIRDSTAAFFVCGQTGAGKSTLLNELGSVSAQEGIGRPVTTHFEGFPLNERGGVLWDGPGFERGNSASELLREIRPTLNVVDLVWFCFRGGSHRYDDAELDVVAYLRESVPTVLVITQDVDGELGKVLEGDPRVSGLPVVSVLAREWTLRSGTVEAFGLDALAGVSIEAIRQGTTSKA